MLKSSTQHKGVPCDLDSGAHRLHASAQLKRCLLGYWLGHLLLVCIPLDLLVVLDNDQDCNLDGVIIIYIFYPKSPD